MEDLVVYSVADKLMQSWFPDRIDDMKNFNKDQYLEIRAVAIQDAKTAIQAYQEYFADDWK